MRYEHLKIDVEGPVATVTLSRPEVHNAMDEQTMDEIKDAFDGLGKARTGNHPVRAVVLRGDGPDFCAGADIRWMKRSATLSPAKNRAEAKRLVGTLDAVNACRLPVIARVHGGVYGGGLGLIAACDAVVAASDSKYIFSECRLGIMPAVISTFVIPKIGINYARRFYLTGEFFGAETARHIGLVHDVVEEKDLDSRVGQIVKSTLKNGPNAVAGCKQYLSKMGNLPASAQIKLSIDTLMKIRSSPEGKEGLGAFLEKRKPAWLERP